jgi:hypothetical protein
MPIEVLTDPVASSRLAGLRYVTDARPGIARKRRGKGFRYVAADGSAIKDEARRHGRTFGSARSPTATCKPPGATLADASRAATIRAGARCATKTSTSA